MKLRHSILIPLLPAALFVGCSSEASDGPRSTLLVTLDTTRADALSCYGAPAGTTPGLDQLAQQGIRFTNARATAPLTLPSHASMLTGLYPPRHGLRNNGLGALSAAADTLAEAARAQGYQTGAFIAAVVLDDVFGLDQGFDRYDTPTRVAVDTASDYAERPADEVVDAALAWISTLHPDRPFFAWVHLFDPHGPNELDASARDERSAYLREVSFVDKQVVRLVNSIDKARERFPVVLIVGDHGEGFEEHDEPTHGTFCYDSTLRVPMILRYPDGFGAGTVVADPVSVVDVFPTLLEAMGAPAGPGVDGVSLYRRDADPARGVYFESYYGYYAYGWSPITGWADRRGKYLHSTAPEFFALDEDPDEARDVSAARSADVDRYLAAIRTVAAAPALPSDTSLAGDADLAESLRSLGYAGSIQEGSEAPDVVQFDASLPAPRASAQEHKAVMDAQYLMDAEQDFAGAEQKLRALVAKNPGNYMALDQLGRCLVFQERFDEASELLAEVVANRPQWPTSLVNLSICLSVQEREEEALACLDRALAIDPNHTKALTNATLLLEGLGRADEARAHRVRFYELTGQELPRVESDQAVVARLVEEGDLAGAIAKLEEVRAASPEDVGVVLHMQALHRQSGDLDRAIELLVEARESHPLEGAVLLNLGDGYLTRARASTPPAEADVAAALGVLERACELIPGDANAHGLRAEALTAAERGAEAIEAYLEAVKLDAKSALWLGKAARALSAAGRFGEAAGLLEQVDELEPDSPRTLFLLGGCRANAGDLVGAQRTLRRAAELAPDDANIQGALRTVEESLRAASAGEGG